MTWLAWRQFRTPVLVTGAGLLVVGAYLVYLGLDVRDFVAGHVTGCGDPQTCDLGRRALETQFHTQFVLAGGLLLVVPALLGAFWGAPLVAREVETGTHRLVWSQSITRTHWLAVRLTFVLVAGLVVSGAFAWLLTWAAAPYDAEIGSRFASFTFGSRGLVPLGYAALGIALGVTLGLAIRRTLPALALTFAVMAVVQVAMPLFVRPHLLPPKTEQVAVDGDSLARLGGLYLQGDRVIVEDYNVPGAWVFTGIAIIRDAAGQVVPISTVKACMDSTDSPSGAGACLATQDLHFDVTYQPAGRYWPFQGIEAGLMVALAAVLVGYCLWRIPRGIP